MSIEWTTVPVLAIIFVATLIRSAFGFGEALVAVPLLALLMPVEVAAPLMINRRLDGRRFVRYVYCVLVVVGAVLLIQSLRS